MTHLHPGLINLVRDLTQFLIGCSRNVLYLREPGLINLFVVLIYAINPPRLSIGKEGILSEFVFADVCERRWIARMFFLHWRSIGPGAILEESRHPTANESVPNPRLWIRRLVSTTGCLVPNRDAAGGGGGGGGCHSCCWCSPKLHPATIFLARRDC